MGAAPFLLAESVPCKLSLGAKGREGKGREGLKRHASAVFTSSSKDKAVTMTMPVTVTMAMPMTTMKRQGKARQGKTRHGKIRQDKTRKTRQDKTRSDWLTNKPKWHVHIIERCVVSRSERHSQYPHLKPNPKP